MYWLTNLILDTVFTFSALADVKENNIVTRVSDVRPSLACGDAGHLLLMKVNCLPCAKSGVGQMALYVCDQIQDLGTGGQNEDNIISCAIQYNFIGSIFFFFFSLILILSKH